MGSVNAEKKINKYKCERISEKCLSVNKYILIPKGFQLSYTYSYQKDFSIDNS